MHRAKNRIKMAISKKLFYPQRHYVYIATHMHITLNIQQGKITVVELTLYFLNKFKLVDSNFGDYKFVVSKFEVSQTFT